MHCPAAPAEARRFHPEWNAPNAPTCGKGFGLPCNYQCTKRNTCLTASAPHPFLIHLHLLPAGTSPAPYVRDDTRYEFCRCPSLCRPGRARSSVRKSSAPQRLKTGCTPATQRRRRATKESSLPVLVGRKGVRHVGSCSPSCFWPGRSPARRSSGRCCSLRA